MRFILLILIVFGMSGALAQTDERVSIAKQYSVGYIFAETERLSEDNLFTFSQHKDSRLTIETTLIAKNLHGGKVEAKPESLSIRGEGILQMTIARENFAEDSGIFASTETGYGSLTLEPLVDYENGIPTALTFLFTELQEFDDSSGWLACDPVDEAKVLKDLFNDTLDRSELLWRIGDFSGCRRSRSNLACERKSDDPNSDLLCYEQITVVYSFRKQPNDGGGI